MAFLCLVIERAFKRDKYMRKIGRIVNIALISTITGVFFIPRPAYSLRVPIYFQDIAQIRWQQDVKELLEVYLDRGKIELNLLKKVLPNSADGDCEELCNFLIGRDPIKTPFGEPYDFDMSHAAAITDFSFDEKSIDDSIESIFGVLGEVPGVLKKSLKKKIISLSSAKIISKKANGMTVSEAIQNKIKTLSIEGCDIASVYMVGSNIYTCYPNDIDIVLFVPRRHDEGDQSIQRERLTAEIPDSADPFNVRDVNLVVAYGDIYNLSYWWDSITLSGSRLPHSVRDATQNMLSAIHGHFSHIPDEGIMEYRLEDTRAKLLKIALLILQLEQTDETAKEIAVTLIKAETISHGFIGAFISNAARMDTKEFKAFLHAEQTRLLGVFEHMRKELLMKHILNWVNLKKEGFEVPNHIATRSGC